MFSFRPPQARASNAVDDLRRFMAELKRFTLQERFGDQGRASFHLAVQYRCFAIQYWPCRSRRDASGPAVFLDELACLPSWEQRFRACCLRSS